MCRWMGSHFYNWSDYNGVANFRIFEVSRDSKWEDSRLKNQKLSFIQFNNKLALPALHSVFETTLIRQMHK